MILSEYLGTIPDDKVIYLGAAVAFVYGGTKKGLLEAIPELDLVWHEKYLRDYERLSGRVESYTKTHGKFHRLTTAAVHALEKLGEYIPFLERQVLKVYDRETEEGTNIIVEGLEQGRIWSVHEKDWTDCEIKYNVEALSGAIVREVVDGYRDSFRWEIETLKGILDRLERYRINSDRAEAYIRSDDFKVLCPIEPEAIIREARRLVIRELREIDRREVEE